MAQVTLSRLLRRNKPFHAILDELLALAPVALAVEAVDGSLVAGTAPVESAQRVPVTVQNQRLGWVSGDGPQATLLAQLIATFLTQEVEKRALATEMLDQYRELNLLYTLSERLLVEPNPAAIAQLALAEAGRLIKLTAGWVILLDGETPTILGSSGAPPRLKAVSGQSAQILQQALGRREPEIRNGVSASDYFDDPPFSRCALLCAPLRTEQRILGTILLVAADPTDYAARDLKLLNTVSLQVAPMLEMARLYQVAVEKGRIERELQLAYQVQSGLIPATTPTISGWQFAGRWQPARELSGDYYDFITEADEQLGLVIGDVADKGMPSALFMVHTRAAVRSAVAHSHAPAEAISIANRLVTAESTRGLFVTLLYAQLDTASGCLTVVNAGHNPALHYKAADRRIAQLPATGLPLGILDDQAYHEQLLTLQPNDLFILYTDGVTEAVNGALEQFGLPRLEALIRKNAAAPAETIAAAIEAALHDFVGGEPPFDDITFVVVKACA